MSENKTQPTDVNPRDFIASLTHSVRKADALTLLEIFEAETGAPAVMWGESIIGFGSYHYKYESGREGDFLRTGFSPRKTNLSLYLMTGAKSRADLLSGLGPHKTGVACLYVTQLKKIDLEVLREFIRNEWQEMARRYGSDATQ